MFNIPVSHRRRLRGFRHGRLRVDALSSTSVEVSWDTARRPNGPLTEQLELFDGSSWANVAGATSSPSTVSGLLAETAYTIRVAFTDSERTIYSNEIDFTTSASSGGVAPTIGTQPQSLTVQTGNSVSFTVAASGDTPLVYQWQSRDSGGLWGDITGETASSLSGTAGSGEFTDGREFRCIVTNSEGTVTSDAATLNVFAALSAGTISESSKTDTSITVTWTAASGGLTPVTAQLQINDGSGWSDVSGAISSPATASGLTAETSYDLRVVWTDADSNTATSNVVTVVTDAESSDSLTAGTLSLSGTSQTSLTVEWTPATGPLAAGTLTEEAVGDTFVLLSWTQASGGVGPISLVLEYRQVGDPDWTEISSPSSPELVTGLALGTDYEFRGTWTDSDSPATVVSETIQVTTASSAATVTGGTVEDAGGFRTHTLLDGESLSVSGAAVICDVLRVGGGGGGSARGGGGGGAGEVFVESGVLLGTGVYPATVGAGGVGANAASRQQGESGQNTSFNGITVLGGGGGGGEVVAASGGSGGGGGDQDDDGGLAIGAYLGHPGGSGQGANAGRRGGGGGGAGAAGGDAQFSGPGAGGDGVEWPPGSGDYYGGGGAGSGFQSPGEAPGGVGGGGASYETQDADDGVDGTGGGGGAGVGTDYAAGNGGSGTIKVRYPL